MWSGALTSRLAWLFPLFAVVISSTTARVAAAAPPVTTTAALPVRFVDVSAERGLGPYFSGLGLGSGLAAADYDSDGDIDIFVPQANSRPDKLYRNRGDGTFEEIGGLVGLGTYELTRVALWLDYDADGDLDLFAVNDDPDAAFTFKLFRQVTPDRFEDVTVEAGLVKAPAHRFGVHQWGGICAGDLNNDGYLDLYTAEWFGPSHLFLNTRQGGFVDLSDVCGMPLESDEGGDLITFTRWGSVMYDFDRDGWLDIYTAVDFSPNELWINQRNNTFADSAVTARTGNWMNDMGIALGDYDNDGDMDVYCTNITIDAKHNVLYRNDGADGVLRFTEVANDLGVDSTAFGWGCTFLDVDNDGDLDLAATNGYQQVQWAHDSSVFFLNEDAGRSRFRRVSDEIGFNDDHYGSALLAADFDRDGDLDLLQACLQTPYNRGTLRLLDNQTNGDAPRGHYLVVRPRSERTNRFAIGAVVRATAGARRLMRPITAGISFMSQEPAEAFFGLGEATVVDTVTVEWPDGDVTTLTNVPADQVLDVVQPLAPVAQPVEGLWLEMANPTGATLRVRFGLPESTPARLELMDVSGRLVARYDLGALDAGPHSRDLGAGLDAAPGVYVMRLTQGGASRSAKVAVIR